MKEKAIQIGLALILIVAHCCTSAEARRSKEEFLKEYNAAQNIGDVTKMAEVMTEGIAEYPKNADFYVKRAAACNVLVKYEDAKKDADRAIELDPSCALAYATRASIFFFLGNKEASMRDMTRRIELDPRSLDAYNTRAASYMQDGKNSEAISDFGRAIMLSVEFPPKASDYETMMRRHQELLQAYGFRAALFYKGAQYDRAVEDYTHAIEDLKFINAKKFLGVPLPTPYEGRAAAYRMLGKIDLADADLKANSEFKTKFNIPGNEPPYHQLP